MIKDKLGKIYKKLRKSPIPYQFRTEEDKPSELRLLKEKCYKKGYELINITSLLKPELGTSGWTGNFEDYQETIHHIKLYYQGELVATVGPEKGYVIDDKKYLLFITNRGDMCGADFIIFRKVPIEKENKRKKRK